ncbi:MAG: hypothetical protein QXR30_03235 [Candidatus Woesearchaeota archaeon]
MFYRDIIITKNEFLAIILASLITGFSFSFNDWGYETFSFEIGIVNLQKAIIVSFIAFTLLVLVAKFFSNFYGVGLTIELNVLATILGFLFTYIIYGVIPIPAFLNFNFYHDPKLRFGQRRPLPNFTDYEKTSKYSSYIIFFLLILMFLFIKQKYILKFTIGYFFYILPIPKVPGFYVFINGKDNIKKFLSTYIYFVLFAIILYFISS